MSRIGKKPIAIPAGVDVKVNGQEIVGENGTYTVFTDEMLKKYPDIDPSRVGETGGSYGGFMTNWIIGHTDRFKAAASMVSISNWLSMYGTTDISYFVRWGQKGSPWRDWQSLWLHSPLKYADRVTTPTLFIQNEKDYRCPIEQAEQMFRFSRIS